MSEIPNHGDNTKEPSAARKAEKDADPYTHAVSHTDRGRARGSVTGNLRGITESGSKSKKSATGKLRGMRTSSDSPPATGKLRGIKRKKPDDATRSKLRGILETGGRTVEESRESGEVGKTDTVRSIAGGDSDGNGNGSLPIWSVPSREELEREGGRYFNPPNHLGMDDKEQQEAITRHVRYLNEFVRPLRHFSGSYEKILAGNTALNQINFCELDVPTDLWIKFHYTRKDRKMKTSYVRWYETGRDLKWLANAYPNGGYKFYLSLELLSEKQRELGESFVRELIHECARRRLSIISKSGDFHNYDSFNIYTWDLDGMGALLRELHEKYHPIFQNVPHFFQGQIDGVPQEHIGYVQEPIGGWPPHDRSSHSGRMQELGALLDDQCGDRELTEHAFLTACKKMWIRPEMPWLIDETAI